MGIGDFLTARSSLIILLVSFFVFTNCVSIDEEEPKRLYKKQIEFKNGKLLWFYISNLSTITPDYVIYEKDGLSDTICHASNLENISVERSVLIFYFNGSPRLYDSKIVIPNQIRNFKIQVDTADYQ